ncbi:MAG TPA: hypothetical protein VET89_07245 [Stellaceae bacterium]|nr:hypothetical protein [Stellaceae bacterium]
MARFRDRILHRLGYLPVDEVQALCVRIGRRVEQLDESITREYVLDPYPGGIEHKITLLCRRRKTYFTRIAEEELGKITGEAAAPPSARTG